MRPIQLKMSAFGSYGREVEINFSNLGGEVFLITGDTGAGKTTIFDAIMYALYGKTSGGERDGSMMRSQFAAPEAKTYVYYVFSYGNEIYKIERNPEYSIEVTLKNGNVKNRKVSQSVELTLPDNRVFPGKKTEIDAKIEDIIGLTSEQFTQMAMIVQGDFLKLIYAKSDERKKIFSRLFGTGVYYKIQDELRRYSGAMDDAIEDNRRFAQQDFARAMLPEGFVGEKEEGKPLELLEAYLLYGKEKEKALELKCREGKKTLQKLNEQIAKAEVIEKTFSLLEKASQRQQELEESAKEQENQKKRLKQAEAADLVWQVEERLKDTRQTLLKNQSEQQELFKQEEKITRGLALYDKIKKWIELCYQAGRYQQLSQTLKQHEKQQEIQDKLRVDWEKTTQESIRLAEIYNTKYRIFLQEQAGILAENLEENSPCPVCGSLKHPNPARLSKEAVSEEEVNRAKENREQAEVLRQSAENSYRIKAENVKAEWLQIKLQLEKEFSTVSENMHIAQKIVEEAYNTCKKDIETYAGAFLENEEWQKFYQKYSKKFVESEIEKKADAIYQEMLSRSGRLEGELEGKKAQEKELSQKYKKEEEQYIQSIKEAGFANEEAYRQGILSKSQQEKLQADIKNYENDWQKNAGELKSLKEQVRGKTRIDMEMLKEGRQEADRNQRQLERQRQDLHMVNVTNEDVKKRLQMAAEKFLELQEEDAIVKILYKTANGRLAQSVKMDLETYVQRQYFRQIIRQANKRFLVMTNQQFMLQIKEEITGKGKNEGLDLQVYSLVTGGVRDIKTLSGGESFLAALSMALGLSDIVQQNTGGIHLDMMFIDEGFGSLDGESRKKAIEVLDELSGGHRMIGIISHVTELKEQMEKKLVVTRNEKGSSICWENL